MEKFHDNQLVKRFAKLVQQNKELNQEFRLLQEKYEDLLRKCDEYEQIVSKYAQYSEVKEVLSSDRPQSQKFNMVTVLYAELHSHNGISQDIDSDGLMDQLDQLYIKFDEIIGNYPIAKIKTIGDSYMCAGGIPEKNITNPVEVILAALQMLQSVWNYNHNDRPLWEIRLAVHTGPVSATVTGKQRVSYDIKGDTVNIASRMESSGKNGTLLISVMTYELVKEIFVCEYYGKLPVKYKGILDIYSVVGIKSEFSEDEMGLVPNQNFKTKFQLLQFHDIQELIFDKLEKELPHDLFYHNLKHTVDVVTEVELIGWAEGLPDSDILLLKTAALFHDCGHTISYDNHEYHSTTIAQSILPQFNFSQKQINQICEIIMSTKLPPNPQNILESIICDADLDYLGRIDFIPVSNTLFEELKVRNKIGSLNDWNKLQLSFISNHQYFTHTARKLREVNKQSQIERIRQLIT